MRKPLFQQVTFVGLGLIGGSLGMALKKRRLARRVIGFSRSPATIRKAKSRGAIDDGCTELCPEWLGASDLVVIAAPPDTVVDIALRIAKLTHQPLLLTDVASTKQDIVQQLERKLPRRIRFVGAHPMAGSERSGIAAACHTLFEDAVCILTRTSRTDPAALRKVSSLWRAVGARQVTLSPKNHDRFVAQVSHAPHLAAVGLVLACESSALKFAAGGFSDMTRVALSDPSMWRGICATNRRDITRALAGVQRELSTLKSLLADGKSAALLKKLQAAQKRRQQLRNPG